MSETRRARGASVLLAASLCLLFPVFSAADPPANLVDKQRIIHSLQRAPEAHTRGLVVAARPTAENVHRIALDIRFANDSDRLTEAAHAQLAELGSALSSAELAHTRFMIAGHTSATGAS
ncbi:MAG: hypothetical protein JO005_00725, partial [Gammaproteobacteria bacterium]|nr:hypothetical protein [Gammaproteobacteria bacterium]